MIEQKGGSIILESLDPRVLDEVDLCKIIDLQLISFLILVVLLKKNQKQKGKLIIIDDIYKA
jgi:hypothetical protein